MSVVMENADLRVFQERLEQLAEELEIVRLKMVHERIKRNHLNNLSGQYMNVNQNTNRAIHH